MKIFFDKIGTTSKPVRVTLEGVVLEGTIVKSGYHRVMLNAQLQGNLEMSCDRCGEEYLQKIESDLKLTLSDQISEDKDDLDIIEFLDGEIDLSYILQSEINTFQSTYHYCSKCEHDDTDFEVEY